MNTMTKSSLGRKGPISLTLPYQFMQGGRAGTEGGNLEAGAEARGGGMLLTGLLLLPASASQALDLKASITMLDSIVNSCTDIIIGS